MNLDEYASHQGLLMCGLPVRGLAVLLPNITRTYAEDGRGKQISAQLTVFATPFTDVAVFAAAIWSRDRWSGWHTYEDGDEIWHEFFAVPCVLRDAMMGHGGSI